MAHCFDVVGAAVDHAVICVECATRKELRDGDVIFRDSEWEGSAPCCERCGEELEVSVINIEGDAQWDG